MSRLVAVVVLVCSFSPVHGQVIGGPQEFVCGSILYLSFEAGPAGPDVTAAVLHSHFGLPVTTPPTSVRLTLKLAASGMTAAVIGEFPGGFQSNSIPLSTTTYMTFAAPTTVHGAYIVEVTKHVGNVTHTCFDTLGPFDFVFGQPVAPPEYLRGDCDDDGGRSLADAVATLGYLFQVPGSPSPSCLDACDANDDGSLDLADATHTLLTLFPQSGQHPPWPQWPDACHLDYSILNDSLDCDSYAHCP